MNISQHFRLNKDEIIAIVRTVAPKHSLDPSLILAIIEQESGFDTFAYRYEKGFFKNYIEGMDDEELATFPPCSRPTEAIMRATSWGLMQVMGQVARERGFRGPFLSSLCDPLVGIEYGCKHFAAILASRNGDINAALQRWNGGGNPNYDDEVLARQSKYI